MSTRRALIVGVADYEEKTIADLPAVETDVAAMREALHNSNYDVQCIGAGTKTPASRSSILQKVRSTLKSAQDGEIVLFYFSGHGGHLQGKDWLYPKDAVIDDDELDDYLVSLDFTKTIENSKAKGVVFFIDACREGVEYTSKTASAVAAWGSEKRAMAANRLVAMVFGCTAGEYCRYAKDDNGRPFSLFSAALAQALDVTSPATTLNEVLKATDEELQRLCQLHYPALKPQETRIQCESSCDGDVLKLVICEGAALGKCAGDRPGFVPPSEDLIRKDYIKGLIDQHGYIRFVGLAHRQDLKNEPIDRLFVEPCFSTTHIRPDQPTDQWPDCSSALDTIRDSRRLVLLGDPGSGKSTLLSWITWRLICEQDNQWKQALGRLIPIPMVLRDMKLSPNLNWERLLDAFLATKAAEILNKDGDGRRRLSEWMQRGEAILLLDGLDEIGSMPTRQALRAAVLDGMNRYRDCHWILASRIVGYEEISYDTRFERGAEYVWGGQSYSEPNVEEQIAKRCYIAPFSDAQIEQFAENWYRKREPSEHLRKQGAAELLNAIRANAGTSVLARNPILLTLIALIYRVDRHLPHGRALLYERIAEAYLESIDQERHIESLDYKLAQKKRWLAYVGYRLQERRESERDKKEAILVSQDELHTLLVEAMQDHVAEPEESAKEFMDHVARRSGLLIPRGEGQYAFAHLSFQEYFAACHLKEKIVLPTQLAGKSASARFPADQLNAMAADSTWREVLILVFELLADLQEWAEHLLTLIFGEQCSHIEREKHGTMLAEVSLLTAVSLDRHAGLSPAVQHEAWTAIWRWRLREEYRHSDGDSIVASLITADRGEGMRTAFDDAVERLNREGRPITRLRFWHASFSDGWLGRIAKINTLQQLELWECMHITNAGLEHLSKRKPLQILALWGCTQITDAGLKHLAELKTLQKLDLWECQQITDAGLKHLAELKTLQKLDLKGCTQITDAGLKHLAELKTLQQLDLSACTRITDTGLRILAGMRTLQQLNLLGCTQITDAGLKNLAEMKTLQKLNLAVCEQVTDTGLKILAEMMTLQQLNLSGCTQITDAGIKNLTGMKTLKELYLSRCKQITDTGLRHLAGMKTLKELYLSRCKQITDTGLKSLAGMKTIHRLSLSKCTQITDTGLKNLAAMKLLQQLYLWKCEQITDIGLKQLAEMDTLQLLDLRECKQITDTGLEHLASSRSLRHILTGGTNATEKSNEKLQRRLEDRRKRDEEAE